MMQHGHGKFLKEGCLNLNINRKEIAREARANFCPSMPRIELNGLEAVRLY